MKAYLITTSMAFALVLIAHVLRMMHEGISTATEPLFVVSTLISAALFGWALVLLRSTLKQ
jgi:heme/copper-type cytochrome/quinol oxidase subunit 1